MGGCIVVTKAQLCRWRGTLKLRIYRWMHIPNGSQFLRDGDELTRYLDDSSRSGSYLGTLLLQLVGVRDY